MPISAPEKVATSPNATRSDSWIWPSGSIKSPQNNNTRPPKLRTEAVMSCKFTFIFLLFFEIECKYAHNFGGFAIFFPKSFLVLSWRTIIWLPSVAEEGFNIGVGNGLVVDFLEALHEE